MEQKEKYEAAMMRLKGQLDEMKSKDGVFANYILLSESTEDADMTTIMTNAKGRAIARMLCCVAIEDSSLKRLAAMAFVLAMKLDDEFRATVMMLLENTDGVQELKEKHGLS